MNYYTQRKKHSFPPLINRDSKILILGSFPSVKSRENNFYYMHPQNRFYKILTELLGVDFYNADIENKKRLLLKYHIALYDVVESCEIENSDDSSIKNVKFSNINKLIKNTEVSAIFLNGKKAFQLFKKNYPNWENNIFYLPSSSPANAKYSLSMLVEEWKIILEKLQ